jgi:hypothetical protein
VLLGGTNSPVIASGSAPEAFLDGSNRRFRTQTSNTSTFIAGNSSRTRFSSAIWCGPPERLFDALRSPKLTTTGG